jgi:hypothetical protein
VAGLELVVRAALACGRREEAGSAAAEIGATAEAVRTRPLQAAALLARARLAAADGDAEAARLLRRAPAVRPACRSTSPR